MEKIKLTLPSVQNLSDLGIKSPKLDLSNSFWSRRSRTSTDLVTITGGIEKRYRGYEWNSDNYDETFVIATSGNQADEKIMFSVKPVIESKEIYEELRKKATKDEYGRLIVEYGEYPQWVVSDETRRSIENVEHDLYPTGQTFTIYEDSEPLREYAYNGKKIVRLKFRIKESDIYRCTLDSSLNWRSISNGHTYNDGASVWLEVLPVRWIVDDKNERLVAESALISGVSYDRIDYFMNNYMVNDMFQSLLTKTYKDDKPQAGLENFGDLDFETLVRQVQGVIKSAKEYASVLGQGEAFTQQMVSYVNGMMREQACQDLQENSLNK